MANTPVRSNNSEAGKNNTLACPECDQLWNKCQCSTRRVEVDGSLLGRIESASNPNSDDGSADDLRGTTIASKYEIIKCLGQGGMGGVYLAEHVTLRKRFAIKILRKTLIDDEVVVERLRREAKACAMLIHQNLVSVFDFGVTETGFPYIVMEFIDGVDLTEVIDNSKIDPRRVARLSIQICRGLEAAHAKDVVHRDLKPSNILVSNPGAADESIRIVDFGIAKSELPGGEMQHLTQTGEVLGSPAYMSPEQIQGIDVDGRSDIYAFGCILYEMLTQKQLFRGHTMFATLEANLTQGPPDLSELSSSISGLEPLYEIMQRCLEKDRDSRYQSCQELRSAFEEFLSERQKTGFSSERKILISVGALVVALVVYGFVFLEPKGNQSTSKETEVVASNSSSSDSEPLTTSYLEGIQLDHAELDRKALDKYKDVFIKSNNINLKLASATEYLNQRRSDLRSASRDKQAKLFEDIYAVRNRAQRIVERALKSNDPTMSEVVAAQVYWEVSKTRSLAADYFYGKHKEDSNKRGVKPLTSDQLGLQQGSFRNSFLKSVEALKKGIRLLEDSEVKSNQLSSLYARLGKHLKKLGLTQEAIAAYKKAIEAEEQSAFAKEATLIVSWYFSLADLYISTEQEDKAKICLEQFDKKYRYVMNLDQKKKYAKLIKKIGKVD